jgi:hypothetical protein
VDEVDLNKVPCDHNPAARFLAGQPLPTDTLPHLQEQFMQIQPAISPELTEPLVNYQLDGIPNNRCFGFRLNVHNGFGHLHVESLIPGSFVFDLLKEKDVECLFLLATNGIEMCTLMYVKAILDDVYIYIYIYNSMIILSDLQLMGALSRLFVILEWTQSGAAGRA